MSSATALSLVASAIFLVRLIPQPARLWRTGVSAGVSPVAAANAVTSATAWLVYGAVEGLTVVWVVSVAALVPGVWCVALLRRRYGRRELLATGAVAGAFALSGLFGVLGAALALGVLVTAGPQVWRAIRDSDLRGIARATWLVAIADALSWGAYGVVIADRALQGYGIVLSASAAIVLARVAWTGRRRTDTPVLRVAAG
jgi:uncharacterized protein with PQ loop repeat